MIARARTPVASNWAGPGADCRGRRNRRPARFGAADSVVPRHERGGRNRLISRNSRSGQSACASSKGRSCRHCSGRRKSLAGRNSASRHRIRNNSGPDRYTRDAGYFVPRAKPQLSACKPAGCYSVAADSPAGSRSRASVASAVSELEQPLRQPAAATGRERSIEIQGVT